MRWTNTCIAFLMMGTTLAGCESSDGLSKQQMGTGLGAAVGGAVGSLFGEGSGKVVAVALGATVGGVLGNQIGRRLDERDMAAIEQQTASALEEADDNETVVWSNPESGASAKVTPRATQTAEKKVAVVRYANVAPTPTLELIGKPYQARQDANVGAAPTTDAQVVAGLRRGETINAVGRVEGRDWYMIARDGRSIGYVSGGLIEPASVAAQTQLRKEPLDLDAIELGEGVVVDTVSAHTECRTLDLEVAAGDTQEEQTSFEACKAADGAWELG